MGKRPNILFFLSDQHSPRFLQELGDRFVETPNFDRLAHEGLYFENCYCQNPLCVPSRASLITGKYSRNLGIYENRHVLESNTETLPRVLSEAGYRTCLIGKSHFNGEQFQGYQQRPYGDLFGQGHQPEYIRDKELRNNANAGLGDLLVNSGATDIPLPMTQTEIVVSETAKWLQQYVDQGSEQPFMLSVHFDKPHFPYRAPKELFEKYEGKVKLPENHSYVREKAVEFVKKGVEVNGAGWHYEKDWEMHLNSLAAYCACVEWVDSAVGRIVDCLDFLGLGEDTIVIYSADHGEMAGEKGAWQKTLFFDDSASVPFFVRWKGHLAENEVRKQIIGLVDMYPTICDYAGVTPPDDIDGVSVRKQFEADVPMERDGIYSESSVLKVPEHSGCMLRTDRFKYNYYLLGKHELYDMIADPHEENNLIDDPAYAAVAKEMHDRVEKFWEPEHQIERYMNCPIMKREKHFFPYSNQFLSGDGVVTSGRP